MESGDLARAFERVNDSDDPRELERLEAALLALEDAEAASVARQAALKRRRLRQES